MSSSVSDDLQMKAEQYDWEDLPQNLRIDPDFGDVQRALDEILESTEAEGFEINDDYMSLLEDSMGDKSKRRAYLAAIYRDSERVTSSEASDIFDVHPTTIGRAETELGIGRDSDNLMETGEVSGFFDEYSDEEASVASSYVREVPGVRVHEARRALDLLRIGDSLGFDYVDSLIDSERDSRFVDLDELDRALSFIVPRLDRGVGYEER